MAEDEQNFSTPKLYTRAEYEAMPTETLKQLLSQYGVSAPLINEKKELASILPCLPDNEMQQQQHSLPYPKYTKDDYETMSEYKLDFLLNVYGLPVTGDITQKRSTVIGAFIGRPSGE